MFVCSVAREVNVVESPRGKLIEPRQAFLHVVSIRRLCNRHCPKKFAHVKAGMQLWRSKLVSKEHDDHKQGRNS